MLCLNVLVCAALAAHHSVWIMIYATVPIRDELLCNHIMW